FWTTSDPVQVKPGVWLAELQTGTAVELKPGDEIAVRGINANCVFLRLALYREAPRRGHGVTGQTFGRTFSCSRPFPQLRLSLQAQIAGPGEPGAQHEATIKIANPLPYAADAVVDWKVADYFGAPVAGKTEPVRIEAHGAMTIKHPFGADGAARAYQLDVQTRPADGFKPPVPRPREMLELNDWARLEFLPNLAGPMDVRAHERIDLKSCNAGGRRCLLLDGGGWERAPLVDRRVPALPPAELKYAGVNVPCYEWWPPKGQFGSWFRKKFKVPEWLRGESLQLEVGRAYREGTVFLNGQRLDGVCRGCIPSRHDVTQRLKIDGENELVVLVRGDVALMRDDYVDLYNPDAWIENDAHKDFPPTNENTACALGSVWLRALPAVRVRQTLVVPDVERNSLLVFSRVENARNDPCTVALRYAFSQEGTDVPAAVVPAQTVALKPGEVLEVKATGTANGLKPYTSSQPVLTRLRTSVVEKGAVVDVEEMRFGYRSVTVQGGLLALNGKPVTFLGTGPNVCPLPGREDGTTIARLVQVTTLDSMDEVGIFHYPPICSSWPASEWPLLNNERYWQRDRDLAVETIWLYASRPSCVGWDISNECYHYACYAVGGEGQSKLGERFFSIAQEVRRRIWPAFWFLTDGNESLGNRLDFTSWHYMNHCVWPADYNNFYGLNVAAFRGVTGTACYPPDSFFLSGAANPPAPDAVIKPNCVPDTWKPGMACAATEEYWFTDQNNGPAIAKYIGDRAAVSTAWQFSTGRGMWWTKLSVEAYRDLGASVMGVYALNFMGLTMQAVTFSVPQQEIRCYGGSNVEKRLTIFDSEYAPGELEFTWKLLGPDGSVPQEQASKIKSATSTIERQKISFKAPAVDKITAFILDMELRKDGKLREHEQRVVEVYPAAGKAAAATVPAGPLALFDPKGKTQAVLEKFGCKVRAVPAIASGDLAGSKHLVIGEDAVKENMTAERNALVEFVRSGGRVLVLPQTDGSIMPSGTHFEKRNYASLGFVRTAGHPVMKGLKDMDFAMWNPGHLIARGLYRTPMSGNFLPLVECFHLDREARTISWSPLLELYMGQGSLLAVQLPIIENLDAEPMAAEIWRRVLAYLSQDLYRRPQARLAVLEGVSEPVLRRLKEIRAEFEIVNAVSAACPVTLVEMNQPDLSKSTDAFKSYVQNGGTLVLHRARPEHQAWLAALTGRKVAVEAQRYHSWMDRQMRQQRAGLAEGLSNIDLYWRPGVGGEGPDSTLQVSGTVAEGKGQVEYVVTVDGAADHLFPGGLLEIPLGKGRIVVDQVKWELPEREKNDYGSPSRVASVMLGNLGVVLKPLVPKPPIPHNVNFEPIDISAVANRGIRDEKAGDDAGWGDWGPDKAINDFPTGDLWFGVPYKVAKDANNAIVLRCNPAHVKSLANLPDTVVVPVNKKNVAGLWFLHTGGWIFGSKPFAWRQVVYADGSRESMPLNNTNCADWIYGRDQFQSEEDTTTCVAWKGACKANPVTRVYHTYWPNPHPEREIKEVVLTNNGLPETECCFIAHLGVTAAVFKAGKLPTPQPQPAQPTQPARDPQRSQALFQEALALKEAKKNAEASSKLEASLEADDQNVSAWMALAEIQAAAGNVERFTAFCQRWFKAMPRNYQAHNVLGKFLEDNGKSADALEQYKKSLEIEWNQPPAIQAVERLERKLGIRK
ncbi:MAG: hypothetical protein NTW87_14715, partial [Planctomycetota bacterium]|nr:hypothetical protein [Planctomycetota bacterium]